MSSIRPIAGAPYLRPLLRLEILALTVALAAVPASRAAGTGAASPPDTTRLVMFLKQTVVTGARYPRAYYESPQALSFLSRGQLRDQLPTVLGDALYGVPGADMGKDSPWEQRPVLRGLGGQRVLVLMDGDPVNSARGNGPHPSLLDPSQVDRIEVVRGPSSVAYGSDAIGGVINIITREAPAPTGVNSLHGTANVEGSSVDRQLKSYLSLMPQIGKFSAYLSSGARKAEDFQTPDHGRVDHSSFSDYNGLANLRYELTERTALKAGWQLYRGHDIGLPGLDFAMPGFEQQFNFPYYQRDAVHVATEHSYPAQSWFENSSGKVYWQSERRNFYSHMAFDNQFFGPMPPGTYTDNTDRYLRLNTVGAQIQASSRKFARYRLTTGVDVSRDTPDGPTVDKTSDTNPSFPIPTGVSESRSLPKGDFDSYAAFAQTEWYVHPEWTVHAGGRYTHYRDRTKADPSFPKELSVDNDALAGSLGLVFAPRADLHLSANVANGYRQPNAQDLFFNGPASVGIVIGNQDLKPEKSVSGDVGLRWNPGSLGLSGNLFYSTYTDLIDAVLVQKGSGGAPDTYQYVNITKARIWGGEAEGEWGFRPGWRIKAAVTGTVGDNTSRESIRQLYGIDADHVPLTGVPPFKGSAGLRWTGSQGRIWVEPSTRYSWRTNRLSPDPLFSNFRKEWIVGDVFAGAKIGSGQRVTVGVKNFTNRAYTLPLGSLEEPGVSFVGALSTDF